MEDRHKKSAHTDPGPTCSVREAAQKAQCSEQTIRRWIADGLLEARRVVPRGSSKHHVVVSSLDQLLRGS